MHEKGAHPLEKAFLPNVFFGSRKIKRYAEETKAFLRTYHMFRDGLLVLVPIGDELDTVIMHSTTIFQWASASADFAHYDVTKQEIDDLLNLSLTLKNVVIDMEKTRESLAKKNKFLRTDPHLKNRIDFLREDVDSLVLRISEEKDSLI